MYSLHQPHLLRNTLPHQLCKIQPNRFNRRAFHNTVSEDLVVKRGRKRKRATEKGQITRAEQTTKKRRTEPVLETSTADEPTVQTEQNQEEEEEEEEEDNNQQDGPESEDD
jgi:hypothetical protein